MALPLCFASFGFGPVFGSGSFGDCTEVTLEDPPGIQIFAIREPRPVGGNPNRFLELFDKELVPNSFIEPDPQTFRSDHYYNTRENTLFKRVQTSTVPHWKAIGRSSGLS